MPSVCLGRGRSGWEQSWVQQAQRMRSPWVLLGRTVPDVAKLAHTAKLAAKDSTHHNTFLHCVWLVLL